MRDTENEVSTGTSIHSARAKLNQLLTVCADRVLRDLPSRRLGKHHTAAVFARIWIDQDMERDTSLARAFGKNILALLVSLFVATVATVPLEGSPEPGSLPRLVSVIVFFSVYTLLYLWDSGHL